MENSGARSVDARTGGGTSHDRHDGGVTTREDRGGKTPAQLYCLLGGLALLAAGIFGFIADAAFDTGNGVDGGKLLGIFEVNGIHNLIHIASGVLLLAASPKRASAKTIALIFGLTYGAVAIIGLIDGSDVLGLIPINGADNILHIALSLVGILAALASPADRDDMRTSTATPRDESRARSDRDRFERDDASDVTGTTTDPMTGRPFGDRVNR